MVQAARTLIMDRHFQAQDSELEYVEVVIKKALQRFRAIALTDEWIAKANTERRAVRRVIDIANVHIADDCAGVEADSPIETPSILAATDPKKIKCALLAKNVRPVPLVIDGIGKPWPLDHSIEIAALPGPQQQTPGGDHILEPVMIVVVWLIGARHRQKEVIGAMSDRADGSAMM